MHDNCKKLLEIAGEMSILTEIPLIRVCA